MPEKKVATKDQLRALAARTEDCIAELAEAAAEAIEEANEATAEAIKATNDAQDQDIGRIYLMLSSAQIFSDGNERIIEDFQDLVDINMADIAVSGLDAGAQVLTAESLSGIRLGGIYMLTDGRVQEYVTVQGISCGESLQVLLQNAITQTYINGTASLKRTTAEITTHLTDGYATGADSTLSMSWLPQRSGRGRRVWRECQGRQNHRGGRSSH